MVTQLHKEPGFVTDRDDLPESLPSQPLIPSTEIDVTVASQNQISKDEFLQHISSEAKELLS